MISLLLVFLPRPKLPLSLPLLKLSLLFLDFSCHHLPCCSSMPPFVKPPQQNVHRIHPNPIFLASFDRFLAYLASISRQVVPIPSDTFIFWLVCVGISRIFCCLVWASGSLISLRVFSLPRNPPSPAWFQDRQNLIRMVSSKTSEWFWTIYREGYFYKVVNPITNRLFPQVYCKALNLAVWDHQSCHLVSEIEIDGSTLVIFFNNQSCEPEYYTLELSCQYHKWNNLFARFTSFAVLARQNAIILIDKH